MIDVDEQGASTIKISTVPSNVVSPDVRDKLVKRFLEGGMFCAVSWENNFDGQDAVLHSMNALDVLQNILDIYSQLIPSGETTINKETTNTRKDFEQLIYKVCSIIEEVSGERSTSFNKKSEYQNQVDV